MDHSTAIEMAGPQPLAAERLERLRTLIRERRAVRLREIASALGVSPATVRRDLAQLEARGIARRVHGGAVSVESRLEEPLFNDKTALHAPEKERIAAVAETFIRPNETVYLDGGSTVLALVRRLRDRTDLTVVTNSLRAAVELAAGGPRLLVIGGLLRRRSETLVGVMTRFALGQIRVDRAFMGTIGLDAEGLTTTDPDEAFTKETAMRAAREVVLLADHSKFGVVSFARSGAWTEVDWVITDRPLRAEWTRILKKAGVRWKVAGR